MSRINRPRIIITLWAALSLVVAAGVPTVSTVYGAGAGQGRHAGTVQRAAAHGAEHATPGRSNLAGRDHSVSGHAGSTHARIARHAARAQTVPHAATKLVVTSTADDITSLSSCPASDGTGKDYTLRCAILQANSSCASAASACVNITFAIGATAGLNTGPTCSGSPAVCTITVSSAGGALSLSGSYVVIDGYTQPGAVKNTAALSVGDNAKITVQLDGTGAGDTDGLDIGGTYDTVDGLSVTNFNSEAGIGITGANAVVTGDFVGLSPAGAAAPNYDGVFVLGSGANIGGSSTGGSVTPDLRNVASGNSVIGILVESSGATIQNNLVGVGLNGTSAIPNTYVGVYLCCGATSVTVGGTAAADANVVSGNGSSSISTCVDTSCGIFATGISGSTIRGNFVGVTAGGASLPNVGHGVVFEGGSTNDVITQNTIAHNTGAGIVVGSAASSDNDHVQISHNVMSTNAASPNVGISLFGQSACTAGPTTGAPNDYTPCPTFLSASTTRAVGTACTGCTVEVFIAASASDNEGYTYLGSATANLPCGSCATGVSAWRLTSYAATVTSSQYLTATATAATAGGASETSEFATSQLASAPAFPAGTLIVNTTLDSASPCPDTVYSLRCALDEANQDGSGETVTFAIPASGNGGPACSGSPAVCTITPGSGLPTLTAKSTTIDGYSQSGAVKNSLALSGGDNAVLTIQLDDTSNASGLVIQGANDTIDGLSIRNGGSYGIEVTGSLAKGDRILGNFIGLAADGSTVGANFIGMLVYTGTSAQIGSPSAGDRNVISGNSYGILLETAGGNLVQGNYIGTDRTGTLARPNTNNGIYTYEEGYAPFTADTIGGTVSGAGNLISGNSGQGIYSIGDNAVAIQDNDVGITRSGAALGNVSDGIFAGSAGRHVTISGNAIAYNGRDGVFIGWGATDATRSTISHNSMFANAKGGINLNGQPLTNCTFGPIPGSPNDFTGCPFIKSATATAVTGEACGGCTVELFTAASKTDDEGRTSLGATTASACSPTPCDGTWTLSGSFTVGQVLTATATAPQAGSVPPETSEFAAPAMVGKALIVTSTGDGASCPNGPGGSGYTLRCALSAADADAGGDTVRFAIPASDSGCKAATINGATASVCTITPANALPTLTAPFTTIDGYSQTGARPNTNPVADGDNAVLTVAIDGQSLSPGGAGIVLSASYDTVEGVVLSNVRAGASGGGYGVQLTGSGATYDVVAGVFAGVAGDGHTPAANGTGIELDGGAGGARLGGMPPIDTNLLSGNANYGAYLSGTSTSIGSTIASSLIGTDTSGTSAVPNGVSGVFVYGGSGNSVGWPCCGGNVISGNGSDGVDVQASSGATLAGNYIGTNALGTGIVPNGGDGVFMYSGGNNTVGSATLGSGGNVIGGNGADGIDLLAENGDTITGNHVGFGSVVLGNAINGVSVSNDTTAAAAQAHLARIKAPATASGSGSAVFDTVSNNVIAYNGGTTPNAHNQAGVLVGDSDVDVNVHVQISQNSIFDNGTVGLPALGIQLNSANYPSYPCSYASGAGPNDYVPCPSLSSSSTAGTLQGTACPGCTVELFLSTNEADDYGYGEGRLYLGSTTATGSTPGASSTWSFTPAPGTLFPGQFVTATATQQVPNTGGSGQPPAAYETSEFTANFQVPGTQAAVSAPVNTGWTLLSVPVYGISTASALQTSIDRSLQSPTAVQVIATYANGRFSLFVPGFTADEPLSPTQGVFVLSSVAGTWSPSVSPSSSLYGGDQPVVLSPGWTLVAAPYPEASMTPTAISAQVAAVGGAVQEIATYTGGVYKTWTPAGSGSLTSIPFTSGLWIETSGARSVAWFPH